MELNVVVPEGVPSGDAVSIVVKVGTSLSPAGVTIAVRETEGIGRSTAESCRRDRGSARRGDPNKTRTTVKKPPPIPLVG